MKIDKSKLMKKAWEIAEHGFLNACITEYCGDNRRYMFKLLHYKLRDKRDFITQPHIQKELIVDFTKKDFFAESLRLAWKDEKKRVARELEELMTKIENEIAEEAELKKAEKIARTNENAPRRILVPAEKYSEGEKLRGFIITGLGREFRPNVDMFSMGITPDTEYVQYAYFN